MSRLKTGIFILLLTVAGQGTGTPLVLEGQDSWDAGPYMDYFLESEGEELRIEEVVVDPGRFRQVEGSHPSFYPYSPFAWLRLTLVNPGDTEKKFLVKIYNPFIDEISFYRPTADGGWDREDTGFSLPYFSQRMPNRVPVFEITLPPGEKTWYIRARSVTVYRFPTTIFETEAFQDRELLEFALTGLYFGVIGVILVTNLFYWVTLRDRSYLYYVLTLLCMDVGLILSMYGHMRAMLPEFAFPRSVVVVLAGLSNIIASIFVLELCESRKRFPKVDRLIKMLMIGITPMFWMWYFPDATWLHMITVGFISSNIAILTWLIYRTAMDGFRPAGYVLVGWIVVCIVTGMSGLETYNLIGTHIFSTYGYPISLAFECVVFSFALADRMNLLRSEMEATRRVQLEARAIQSALLTPDKEIPGVQVEAVYGTASAMGGDWYGSFYDEQDGRVILCVGDVSGHGMASSLISGAVAGTVQTMAQNLSGQRLPKREILTGIARAADSVVRRSGGTEERLMTMSFMVVDLQDMSAAFLNAGHNQFYHRQADGVRARLRKGSRLGDPNGQDFGYDEFRLDKGDTLLFFTDGILENSGSDGRSLRVSQLRRAIAMDADAAIMIRNILSSGARVWGESPPEDDYAVLAVHFEKFAA